MPMMRIDGRSMAYGSALNARCFRNPVASGRWAATVGTRVLMDQKLKGARPPGYANQPKSHNAVAAAIAQNRADWGFAIEPVARMYGLGFLPVAPEEYDFFMVESWRERPGVQAFREVLRDEATRNRILALGMRPADD